MAPKRKSDRDQARRFAEAAREAGCDETGEAFEKAFAEIVPPKPRANPAANKKGKT